MRIQPKDTLFDQPILKIRAVIRDAMAERIRGKERKIIDDRVALILESSKTEAVRIVRTLVKEDYLSLKKEKGHDYCYYELIATEKGRRLGNAKADPPISRQKADQLLTELIGRAKEVNAVTDLVYYVERIRVFGSYLSDIETLGDLDVFVKLSRRYAGERHIEVSDQRVELAWEKGRNLSSLISEIMWPYREVILMLKTKKKGLSLHDEDLDKVIEVTESRIVYEFKP